MLRALSKIVVPFLYLEGDVQRNLCLAASVRVVDCLIRCIELAWNLVCLYQRSSFFAKFNRGEKLLNART
jgi:hypothetical protein